MRFSLLFLFMILVNNLFAQQNNDPYSPANRLKFGNRLYQEKDYLRALEEYRSYLKANENDTVQFKFANCFYNIGRYTEAAQNFKTLFWGSSLEDESRLMFFQSIFFQKDYNEFRSFTQIPEFLPRKFSSTIDQLKASLYFLDSKFPAETNSFINVFPDSVQSKLYSFYMAKKNPPLKNPTLAGLISAVIPGAGKVYTEEYTDALTAFVATGLSAYLAITSFNGDHSFRGWLFTGTALFFYGGGIYGSILSARQYNLNFQINLDKEINLFFEQRNYFLPKLNF